jgi:hypothetical protein
MIAAARKIFAWASHIALWPLNMLAKSVTNANKRTIRWAIRNQVGAVYLTAIFWFPTLTVAGATWALVRVHEKPDDVWGPVVGLTLLITKKVMALLTYLLAQAERSIKAIRHYRRHFARPPSPGSSRGAAGS